MIKQKLTITITKMISITRISLVPAAVASTSQLKVDVNPCVTASVDVSSRNMISTEAVGGSCSFADLISVPCLE